MSKLLVASLSVAAGLSVEVPDLAQQFRAPFATFLHLQDGTVLNNDVSDMYYDPPNQRWAQVTVNAPINKTMVADFKNNLGFIIWGGVCTQHGLPGMPRPFAIPAGARDAGPTTTSSGQPAEHWEITETDKAGVTHTLSYDVSQPTAGQDPVMLFTNDTYDGAGAFACLCTPVPCKPPPACHISRTVDYSAALVVGPMDDDPVWTMPAGCAPAVAGAEPVVFKF
jgi:hypothetical protein